KPFQAKKAFSKAVALEQKGTIPLITQAFFLACCNEEECRDGKAAVEMAEKISSIAQNKNKHRSLFLLALAYGERGDFKRAIHFIDQAIKGCNRKSRLSVFYLDARNCFSEGRGYR